MTIRTIPLEQLRPADYNPRTIAPEALGALRESIDRFGLVQPIVWNSRTGNVVSGHQRLKILQERGDAETDVVVVDLPPEDERALNITQNNPAVAGDWDLPKLGGLLAELRLADYDLPSLRLDALEALAPPPVPAELADAEPKPDRAEELRAKWETEPGQLWQIGPHRLLIGDSATCLPELLDGLPPPSVVFTDPPYGVAIADKNAVLDAAGKGVSGRAIRAIRADDLTPEALKVALCAVFSAARAVCAEHCTWFVCAPQRGELGMMMMMMMTEAGLPVRHVLIWRKSSATFSLGRLDYDYAHEPILMTWGARHKRPLAGPFRTSVWEVDKPRANAGHPTIKPVELYTNALLNHSDPGDVLLDPFAGSGTAILAAHATGRIGAVAEIDPAFAAVALERCADAGLVAIR